jgi:outer membrane protein assembly factor BamA
MYKLSKKGNREQLLYDRLFKIRETREIRIYARGGDDEILIRGDVPEAIRLRVIGGEGTDRITDESKVIGAVKTTLIYDTKAGNFIELGTEGRDKTSNREDVNEYDRKDFKYDATAPALFVGYNADDGVFLGGGAKITTHGFRKDPFAASQTIVANYAIKTGAVGMRYDGAYTDVLGKADLGVDFDLSLPAYVRNFFGLGNETDNENESQEELYHFVNYRRVRLETALKFDLGNYSRFRLAPVFQYQRVVESRNEDRFIADTALNTLGPAGNANLYDNFYFLGGAASFLYDDRNDATYPTRGLFFEARAEHYFGMRDYAQDYSRISGNLAIYFTFNPLATTVASRVGGAHNFGEFVFFNANYLDLIQNLRGYRRNRFAGRSSAYWNTELRTRLFHFKNYVAPMDVGLLLVNDYGRVWQDGETSDLWHHGYGAGLWIKPYDALVLSLANVWSDEGSTVAFNMGFMF